MVLTGRTGLIALLCAVPIAVAPRPAATFGVLLALLAVAVLIDVASAAKPFALHYTRESI